VPDQKERRQACQLLELLFQYLYLLLKRASLPQEKMMRVEFQMPRVENQFLLQDLREEKAMSPHQRLVEYLPKNHRGVIMPQLLRQSVENLKTTAQ